MPFFMANVLGVVGFRRGSSFVCVVDPEYWASSDFAADGEAVAVVARFLDSASSPPRATSAL